VPYLTC